MRELKLSLYDTPQHLALKPFWEEPDVWTSCAYGLPVHARRNWQKAWCGYVGVPRSHPHYGKNYGDRIHFPQWKTMKLGGQSPISVLLAGMSNVQEDDFLALDVVYDAPGGLTYSDKDWPLEGNWWFGFDCSHYNDLTPQAIFNSFCGYPYSIKGDREYRDLNFVKRAIYSLASQISNFSSVFPEDPS